MPSLKEFRLRIVSVKSTQKITKALQMVATAKLKRAQEAAQAARPYATRMAAVIANLASGAAAGGGPKLIAGTGSDDVHLLIVLTSERGLCGGFNTNIVKMARAEIRRLQAAGKTVKILTIGKKGADALKRQYGPLIVGHIDRKSERSVTAESASRIASEITSRFDRAEFDVATLVFARFKNLLTQIPTALQLIPAKAPADAPKVDLQGARYIYEPSEEAILETLLPRYLGTQLLSALLETEAGFQGAQMTAMDNATRNAGDMIKSLQLRYNRARQAQITKELIEIISGAEAL
ncbi:MAG TPA: F0F1 ATP synthase subunit gamma [Hyphomonadaceae bacterium]|nr:F0F1 ATP synthase subunit gamma [Hyphomonadaceae bacterium]HPI46704.1 F0F1 ATP synthase subunit gamma [Hyphomonadaceae bacterium]